MTAELTNQVAAGLLILWLVSLLAMAIFLSSLVVGYVKRRRGVCSLSFSSSSSAGPESDVGASTYRPSAFEGACRWLAVRSSNVTAVQGALGLNNPIPCSWEEGLSRLSDHKLFISPPVNGWILVLGQGLPDPSEDVDECYRFMVKLSRNIGQAQFFSANRAINHHAWARAEGGRILRAYAWGGRTLWNQGELTVAERDLGLKCFGYEEEPDLVNLSQQELQYANTEKVVFLAARWSVDPTSVDQRKFEQAQGVVGDFQHSPTR